MPFNLTTIFVRIRKGENSRYYYEITVDVQVVVSHSRRIRVSIISAVAMIGALLNALCSLLAEIELDIPLVR